jgi:hypothetical protein
LLNTGIGSPNSFLYLCASVPESAALRIRMGSVVDPKLFFSAPTLALPYLSSRLKEFFTKILLAVI